MIRALLVALGVAAAGVQAQEASFGRLFYTPQQRAALEDARRKNIRADTLAVESSTKPKPRRSRDVVVNGVITRSDGETTVWVNGKPVDGETDDGVRVTTAGGGQAAVVVQEPERGRSLRLKVGQRADLVTGRIEENYANRQRQAAAQAPDQGTTDASSTEEVSEPSPPPISRRRIRDVARDPDTYDEAPGDDARAQNSQ